MTMWKAATTVAGAALVAAFFAGTVGTIADAVQGKDVTVVPTSSP